MSVDRRQVVTGLAASALAAGTGSLQAAAKARQKVIDIHTHMFSSGWLEVARQSRNDAFQVVDEPKGVNMMYRGSTVGTLVPRMLDYDLRIRDMDEAGVDVAVISLTSPHVFWGSRQESARAARACNTDFAAAKRKYDGRIHFMAVAPWQYPDDAIAELRWARSQGAVGACTLTSIDGAELIDPRFEPVWRELEAMELPVFIHPTSPIVDGSGVNKYGLFNTVTWMAETAICFQKLIWSGFMDRHPRLKLIACHGGGVLPWLKGRFDATYERFDKGRENGAEMKDPPSAYLRKIWFDNIVYTPEAMRFLVQELGADRLMYGSDYPFRLGDMKGVLARTRMLPAEQQAAILNGNASRLFGI